ncbi:hypothetical protein FNV43_RR10681 [Rhamnella rubrinervis]|uniref:SHSP domain-containing protein n=1 Tax=Rhamnella rubrinervis TaxID=2594499 RepID=A0A8K0MH47_9ROSA|nr:hypothetical protein FNV43_RR10681 [Rhamnella rubrinervis]
MELELGLKITKTRNDLTSTIANFELAKDASGPVFISKETEAMFILTAHLKGFRRESIRIKINEDGTQMSISGEKPVQDMVMLGWTMQKQEVELRGFIKVFQIPSGVILDRIKAKFKDEESILTISMPKSVKGISGDGIVEVKEEEVSKERPKDITQIATTVDHQDLDRVLSKKETGANDQAPDEKGEETKDPKVERIPEMTKTVAYEEFLEKEATLIPGKSEEENMEKKDEPNEVDDAGKLETLRNATDEVSEREETPETEDHTAEKATPKVDTEAAIEEPKKEDQPEREMDGTQLTKEHEREEISEMKEQMQKQTSNDKVECETPQDLENQEANKTLQADHDDHLPKQVGEITKEEVQLGVKETGTISEADQTQEAEKSEAKHEEGKEVSETNDSSERGKKKDEVSEGTTRVKEMKKKKPGGSRRLQLCAPCAIAGSALLASLAFIVIHWIRARRR